MTKGPAIPGIPTRYKGRQYRSRLEARWACFFDLLGWRYEYEPCDFEGWIPDFVLCEAQPVFVEVKPVIAFPKDVAAKIDATSCTEEALIVGVTLVMESVFSDNHPCLGWLREGCIVTQEGHSEWEEGWSWGAAPMGVWTPKVPSKASRVGFCHEYQSYHDRITGSRDGTCCGYGGLDSAGVLQLWAQAGNVTQWEARSTLKTTLDVGFPPLATSL